MAGTSRYTALLDACVLYPALIRDALLSLHVEGLHLPDTDDRHVLAAAVRGHADCIVTANTSDFPRDYVDRFDVEVIHPDDFLVLQIDLDALRAMAVFKAMRARLSRPAVPSDAFVQMFVRAGLVRTAARLGDGRDLL